jgi:hypothetical protein
MISEDMVTKDFIKKLPLLTLTLLAATAAFPLPAHAVASNCVVTKIGDAPKKVELPSECNSDGGPIAQWAQKINDKLEKGGNKYYSKMQAEVCNGDKCAHKKKGPGGSCKGDSANCYWCTWLVVDSYNLAGKPIGENLSAVGLINDMKGKDGFGFSGASGEGLKKVKPGWAIGFGGEGHIGIVKSIKIDDRGNGSITTLEANSGSKGHTWPISNFTVKVGGSLPLNGFAGLK